MIMCILLAHLSTASIAHAEELKFAKQVHSECNGEGEFRQRENLDQGDIE